MLSAESEVTGRSVNFFFDDEDLYSHLEEISVHGDFWDVFRDGRLIGYYIPKEARRGYAL